MPKDWVLPKAWGEWALHARPDFDEARVRLEATLFRNHWVANANQRNGKKSDWELTWHNWILKAGAATKPKPLSPSPHVLPQQGVGAYGKPTPLPKDVNLDATGVKF